MRPPFWKWPETWGFGLAILTLIIMTFVALRGWTALLAAREELSETQQIDPALSAVLQTVLDAETGERGFLLTDNDAYLDPYLRAGASITLRLDLLARLTEGNPEQQSLVRRLKQLANARMDELRRAVEARRTGGLPAALKVVKTGEGRRLMDAIRATIAEIKQSQSQLEAKQFEKLLYYRGRVPAYLSAGSGLLLFLLVAGFVVIRHEANAREDALARMEQSRHGAEATRDLLTLTLRSIGDGAIVADSAGRITMLNDIAAHLIGWEGNPVGQRVREVFRIIDGGTGEPVDPIDRIRRPGGLGRMVNYTFLVRPDGRQLPIESAGAPILGPNGEIAGFVMLFRDITERREHERGLLASEQRFSTMADAAPALLWLAAPNGDMSFFNRQWLDFIGRQEEEVIGSGWLRSVHPDDLEQVRSTYSSGIASKQAFHFQTRLLRSDGLFRTIVCSAAPYSGPDNQHAGFVGACFDLSDLEAARHSLEISERRFSTLVAETTALVWQTDGAGNITTRQPQWEEFTGQKWPDYSGRRALDAIHSDDRDRVLADWEKSVRIGQHYTGQFRVWNASTRSWRDVLCHGVPLKDRDGTIIEWIGTITDFTERRAMEERVRQAAKAESLAILAGGIAHDFNNLLMAILGNASLLEGSLSNETHRKIVREVIRASERAAELTRQMLAYSGGGRFVVEELKLQREIAGMEPQLRRMIPAHVQLKLQLDEYTPPVRMDRAQLQQLVLSLAANAAEAIDADSGLVTIGVYGGSLTEDDTGFVLNDRPEPGRCAVLEVRDTGRGIDPDAVPKIFDPFFTTKFTGRGLGLSAALGIVRGHRGGIRLVSRVGEGSTFRIYLPCQPVKREPPSSGNSPVAKSST